MSEDELIGYLISTIRSVAILNKGNITEEIAVQAILQYDIFTKDRGSK